MQLLEKLAHHNCASTVYGRPRACRRYRVFLENNHGKYLADMLFGQLQKRQSTIIEIDGLLRGFECINRTGGSVEGFAVNPLSSVKLAEVFESLGYRTKPPKDFSFQKRMRLCIRHFSVACVPGAVERVSPQMKRTMGNLFPSEPGMVRICSSPPDGREQSEIPYEARPFDVPAAKIDEYSPGVSDEVSTLAIREAINSPLVVPLDHPYSASGHGVVSYRNMTHVWYNGIEFHKLSACPEPRRSDDPRVMEA